MLSSVQNPRLLLRHYRRKPPPLHHHHHHTITNSQIQTLQKSLKTHQTTTKELTQQTLNRIQQTEPLLKSFLHISNTLLAQADEIDKKLERNENVGPLAGVLVGVKDNICAKDMACTAGSKILENYRPAYDASVVRKLRECGAIIVGKTNLDEFGMGSTTEGSAYQVVI